MTGTEQIVRKSEFAALRNVSPGRVTQWITGGQIGPEALVGEGRSARIRVELANQHLRERLDPSQRFGLNGIGTTLDAPSAAPVRRPADVAAPVQPPMPIVDSVEARIKAEKLRQAELVTRRAEEQDRLARGVYILAVDARAEFSRIAAKMFDAFDGALTDFAAAISAKYAVPSRDVLHLLRTEFRRVRERTSNEYASAAEAEAEFLEDDEQHDEPTRQ